MGALVGEVLVEPVRFLAIQLGDDPLVLHAVGPASLLGFLQPDAGVLLHEGRQLAGYAVEVSRLGVVGPLELDAGLQGFRIVVVDGEPDVVRQRQQILADRFKVFEDATGAVSGLRGGERHGQSSRTDSAGSLASSINEENSPERSFFRKMPISFFSATTWIWRTRSRVRSSISAIS